MKQYQPVSKIEKQKVEHPSGINLYYLQKNIAIYFIYHRKDFFDNLPLRASISALTFLPCQLTVTFIPSASSLSFSTISCVGAIPVKFSTGKRNKALRGRFLVSLHNCLSDITK